MHHKRLLSMAFMMALTCLLAVGMRTSAQETPAPAAAVEAVTESATAVVTTTEATVEEAKAAPTMVNSDDLEAVKSELQTNLNIVWTMVAAFLVFFMQAGFALVEAGLTRAKNVVNIIMKNVMDFAMASIGFFFLGYGLMFGKGAFVGTDHFMLDGVGGGDWQFTFFMFQLVFAGTAATIVSGAMAERTKFVSYLVYSGVVTCLIYPVFGHWAWGTLLPDTGATAWLCDLKSGAFCDFAGSTVVHSVGGWLALAGAIVLGPRIGKYGPDGKPKVIMGHNFPLVALGVFILWFGWFGFNPGSTTTGAGDIGRIAVTTNLAGAAGCITAMCTAWILFKKPDGSMTLNGALAGLVAITAPCATVTPMGSIIIGAIAGVLVVLAVVFIDRVLKIDDPVGAVSVHGICGTFGTLACGLFNNENAIDATKTSTGLFFHGGASQLISQLIGAGTVFAWAFGLGMVMFLALKYTIGLRVTAEEEIRGLDIDEHGMEGYAGFQIYANQ